MIRSGTARTSLVVSAVVVSFMAATVATLMTWPGEQLASGPSTLDLSDATAQQAGSAGIKLPAVASHVYYKGRKIPGSSTTYARFDLPRDEFIRYQDLMARKPGARLDENLPVPRTWPNFDGVMAAPGWWNEHSSLASKVVVIEDHAASVKLPPSGRYWVLDGRNNRVYIWSWSVNIGSR